MQSHLRRLLLLLAVILAAGCGTGAAPSPVASPAPPSWPTTAALRDTLATEFGYDFEAMNSSEPWYRTDPGRMYGIELHGADDQPVSVTVWSMDGGDTLIEQAGRVGTALGGTEEAVIEAIGTLAARADNWEGDDLEEAFPLGAGSIVVKWSRFMGLHVTFVPSS